jgi:hypothetical protein
MQNSGGDSIVHRLARCFGQGLAFGFAVALTHQALRPRAKSRESGFAPEARPEPAVEPPAPVPAARTDLDLRAVRAIVSVVEQRIEERAAQTERMLNDLQAPAELDVQADVAREVEAKMADVRGQVAKIQRGFAEAVARVIAQQVAQEVAKQIAVIEAAVQQRIEAAVAPLEAELHELRQEVAEHRNAADTPLRQCAA